MLWSPYRQAPFIMNPGEQQSVQCAIHFVASDITSLDVEQSSSPSHINWLFYMND